MQEDDRERMINERRGRWTTKLLVADAVFRAVMSVARSLSQPASSACLVAVMSELHAALWDKAFLGTVAESLGILCDDNRRGDRRLKEWIAKRLDDGSSLEDLGSLLSPYLLAHPLVSELSKKLCAENCQSASLRVDDNSNQGANFSDTQYTSAVQDARRTGALPSGWTLLGPASISVIESQSGLQRFDIFNRLQFSRSSEEVFVRALYCHADRNVQDIVLEQLASQQNSSTSELLLDGDWFEFVEDVSKWKKEISRDEGRKTLDFRPFLVFTRLSDLQQALQRESDNARQAIKRANKLTGKGGFVKICREFLEFASDSCVVVALNHEHEVSPKVPLNICVWMKCDGPPRGGSTFRRIYDDLVVDSESFTPVTISVENGCTSSHGKGPFWVAGTSSTACGPQAVQVAFELDPILSSLRSWIRGEPNTVNSVLRISFPVVDERSGAVLTGRTAAKRKLRQLLQTDEFADRVALQPSSNADVQWEIRRVEPICDAAARLVAEVADGKLSLPPATAGLVSQAINPRTADHLEYLGDAVLDFVIADRCAGSVRAADDNASVIGQLVSEATCNDRLAELLPSELQSILVNKFFVSSRKVFADTVESVAGAFYASMRMEWKTIDEAVGVVSRYAAFIGAM